MARAFFKRTKCTRTVRSTFRRGGSSRVLTRRAAPRARRRSGFLSPEQQERIAAADTFLVATRHPEAGADAPHRGGHPGFVRVGSSTSLRFPNVETGAARQIRSRATIDDDSSRIAAFGGAERLIDVEEVVDKPNALGMRWQLASYSPFLSVSAG